MQTLQYTQRSYIDKHLNNMTVTKSSGKNMKVWVEIQEI